MPTYHGEKVIYCLRLLFACRLASESRSPRLDLLHCCSSNVGTFDMEIKDGRTGFFFFFFAQLLLMQLPLQLAAELVAALRQLSF